MLTQIDDGLWVLGVPQRVFGVMQLGTRMTVVKLRDGALLLHSPVEMTAQLRAEVDALGPIHHIVSPNLYHHLHAGSWAAAYPHALLHAPEGLAKKRPDLKIHRFLSSAPHPDWEGVLVPVPIDGCLLRETLFVHPRSRTLVSSDLVENFETSDHLPTRLYLQLNGIYGKIGWGRAFRVLYRDHAAARASLDRLLAHDFDRIVVAHGNIVERDGKEAIRAAFTWL